MSAFLKKKNLKAKKGKQKWRKNLDITELQETIAEQPHASLPPKKPLKKPLFFIDPAPSKTIKKSLDPNRFKKKPKGPPSKYELKRISKKEHSSLLNPNPPVESPKLDDAWRKPLNKKPVVLPMKDKTPKNPLPAAGQSYNPSFKDHKNLLQDIVATELSKDDIKHAVSNKVNRVHKEKPKAITQKRLDHQFTLIKKYKRELREKQAVSDLRMKVKEEREKIEEKALEKGKVLKVKRIGKTRFNEKIPDFKLSNELPENLRKINTEGSVVRDAFQNVFRKGRIEPGNPFGAKKKIQKLPKYKYHSTDRRGEDREDEGLGERFHIYNY